MYFRMKYFYSNMKNFGRRDHLRKIETDLQAEWEKLKLFNIKADLEWNKKMSFEEKNETKFMVTFPYPYMNGTLHLGHSFSLSKCEFSSRYQRLKGVNSLFPFAFHCTGMPMAAAANRVRDEMIKFNNDVELATKTKDTQCSILLAMGVEKELIPKFSDPVFWLTHFPPIGHRDLLSLGVNADFSRSFITTDRNVFYDRFIIWQFNRLKERGVIKFGKRFTIFSRKDNQPCGDHDRSEGEGVGVQEYTCIKLKIVGGRMNEKIEKLVNDKKDVFLVAATLRPETMYGQTNCFVLPTGEYGVFELKTGELIVCSQSSADAMSYQELLKEDKKSVPLFTLKGSDLIGVKVNAPFSFYKEVYCIPLLSISMTKGTGIVTSVPSDAPDDYMALKDFQTDEELRKKHNVDIEWVQNYKPYPIIDIPELGEMSAASLCEQRGVKNQQDSIKLKEIKDLVYLKGFTSGVLLVGDYKGNKVEDAKKKVKTDMINQNLAFIYCEPESLVVTRSKEVAIVALVDQWMISYGEDEWKELLENHLKSNKWKSYNPNTTKELLIKINWLKEWGCSRTFGLGSRLPWDTYFLIESLSDSTIYMAFYTIYKYFSEDMFGDSHLIDPKFVNDELFDYVFLGVKSDKLFNSGINTEVLENMRNEFTYWYPMDLRCSGKDLIGNHLTMSLYNHAFIWNKEYLPKSIFANGYMLLNGKIMSKKTGNFMTLRDCVNEYGADASRLTLADCGDGHDDANFLTTLANSNLNKLYTFENFIKALIKEGAWNTIDNFEDIDNLKLSNKFDLIFDNNINYLVEQTKNAYESMVYKNVVKYGFNEMINVRDQYILYLEDDYTKINPSLMLKFFVTFFKIMNPVIPHWTEYMYRTYINGFLLKSQNKSHVIEHLAFSKFPETNKQNIDSKMFSYNRYLKSVISSIHEIINSKQGTDKDKKKVDKKEKKDEEPKEEEQIVKVKGSKIFEKLSKNNLLI